MANVSWKLVSEAIVWNVELTREPMELEGGSLYGTPFGFG